MKNSIFIIIVAVLFCYSTSIVFAQEQCSYLNGRCESLPAFTMHTLNFQVPGQPPGCEATVFYGSREAVCQNKRVYQILIYGYGLVSPPCDPLLPWNALYDPSIIAILTTNQMGFPLPEGDGDCIEGIEVVGMACWKTCTPPDPECDFLTHLSTTPHSSYYVSCTVEACCYRPYKICWDGFDDFNNPIMIITEEEYTPVDCLPGCSPMCQ
ncbi:MAG: hypothetical protein ABFD61_04080 [Chloroherpetonaceae bacterium]